MPILQDHILGQTLRIYLTSLILVTRTSCSMREWYTEIAHLEIIHWDETLHAIPSTSQRGLSGECRRDHCCDMHWHHLPPLNARCHQFHKSSPSVPANPKRVRADPSGWLPHAVEWQAARYAQTQSHFCSSKVLITMRLSIFATLISVELGSDILEVTEYVFDDYKSHLCT